MNEGRSNRLVEECIPMGSVVNKVMQGSSGPEKAIDPLKCHATVSFCVYGSHFQGKLTGISKQPRDPRIDLAAIVTLACTAFEIVKPDNQYRKFQRKKANTVLVSNDLLSSPRHNNARNLSHPPALSTKSG